MSVNFNSSLSERENVEIILNYYNFIRFSKSFGFFIFSERPMLFCEVLSVKINKFVFPVAPTFLDLTN